MSGHDVVEDFNDDNMGAPDGWEDDEDADETREAHGSKDSQSEGAVFLAAVRELVQTRCVLFLTKHVLI
jgi:hypothetical protein